MDSVTWIRIVWALKEAGHSANDIAGRVAVDRSTVYRWLGKIKRLGLIRFIDGYRYAKRGHRHRKTSEYVEERVLAIRRAHLECCGEKIVYWLNQEGIQLSRSTVYRILDKHLQLRVRWRRNIRRGRVPQAHGPREVIQMDTVDFGGYLPLPRWTPSRVRGSWCYAPARPLKTPRQLYRWCTTVGAIAKSSKPITA